MNNQAIDFNTLSEEQKEKIREQCIAQERDKIQKEARKTKGDKRQDLKDVENSIACEIIARALNIRAKIDTLQEEIQAYFKLVSESRRELYGIKKRKNRKVETATIATKDGNLKVCIGKQNIYTIDPTDIDSAKEKIIGALERDFKNGENDLLYRLATDAFKRNITGNYSFQKIKEITDAAKECNYADPDFLGGIELLESSVKVGWKTNLFTAYAKDKDGKWESIPLSFNPRNKVDMNRIFSLVEANTKEGKD